MEATTDVMEAPESSDWTTTSALSIIDALEVRAMCASLFTRGFRGRRHELEEGKRLPPGQYLVRDFPVLSAGPTPHTSLDKWTFKITGAVDADKTWSWEEFRKLPTETVTKDIHCVTKWTKLDTTWTGVPVSALLEGV